MINVLHFFTQSLFLEWWSISFQAVIERMKFPSSDRRFHSWKKILRSKFLLAHYQVLFGYLKSTAIYSWGYWKRLQILSTVSWVLIKDRSLSKFSSVLSPFSLGKVKLTLSGEGTFSKCNLSYARFYNFDQSIL